MLDSFCTVCVFILPALPFEAFSGRDGLLSAFVLGLACPTFRPKPKYRIAKQSAQLQRPCMSLTHTHACTAQYIQCYFSAYLVQGLSFTHTSPLPPCLSPRHTARTSPPSKSPNTARATRTESKNKRSGSSSTTMVSSPVIPRVRSRSDTRPDLAHPSPPTRMPTELLADLSSQSAAAIADLPEDSRPESYEGLLVVARFCVEDEPGWEATQRASSSAVIQGLVHH